ncbi:hypothetical protein K501DRAFT_325345 [Backusella circina FSU 941]|nr:hypothetical protein K501DRAFT_325345 [Backusella circina FSU 941]
MPTEHSSSSILSDGGSKPDFKLDQRTNTFQALWKTRNSFYILVTTILEAIVVIVIESVLFAQYPKVSPLTGLSIGIPVYLMLFIFSMIFQILLVWDATRHKNTIQMIAFIIFNLCCFAYAVFQFKQIDDALGHPDWRLKKLIIVNPIVIGICQLIYFYLGTCLCVEFGWRIYKKIGADPEIRNMYRWYQILLTILKIDIFFFLGFSIQYLVLVLDPADVEFGLTIAALPLTCLLLLLAVYAIRHESTYLIALFFVGLMAGVAYFIFKIIRIYTQTEKFVYVKDFLKFFAYVTLVLIILTIVNASICWFNFGKGLKIHLLQKPRNEKDNLDQLDNERTLSLD